MLSLLGSSIEFQLIKSINNNNNNNNIVMVIIIVVIVVNIIGI
jgi:hypothetical protein